MSQKLTTIKGRIERAFQTAQDRLVKDKCCPICCMGKKPGYGVIRLIADKPK